MLPFIFQKTWRINQKLFNDILDNTLKSFAKVSGSDIMISREAGKITSMKQLSLPKI